MQNTVRLLTSPQLADILQIDEYTLGVLVSSGQIPHTYIQSGNVKDSVVKFNPALITGWLRQGPLLHTMKDKTYVNKLKKQYSAQFPEALDMLQELNTQFSPPKKKKGYNLTQVPNKQLGFVYYVRYIVKGKLVPSRWTTRTNNLEIAKQYAVENRDRLLTEYYAKKKPNGRLYVTLSSYYKEGSKYLATEQDRGRVLGDHTRNTYYNFIIKNWIPFLKANHVHEYEDITPPIITAFQNHLLKKQNKPQTVNRYTGCLQSIFDHLVRDGTIPENPFKKVSQLKLHKKDYSMRGCYDIKQIRGIFERRWPDKYSQLLCMMIYTSGLRNSEIEKIQVKDLIKIKEVNFIDVRKSKTDNGVRIVPLHPYVSAKLDHFVKANKMVSEDYIFSNEGKQNQSITYNEANAAMGRLLGLDEAALTEQGITFYSGRHYWKTMVNAEDLGDVEEYFMGHKVSRDVAKRYNHRDKQGQKKILAKAKEVIKILDKWVFTTK